MFKRRLLRVAWCVGIIAATVFGAGSAANAGASGFYASYVHSGGSGALAVAFEGGMIWGSRSVTLTTPRLYVASGECADLAIWGLQGDTVVDLVTFDKYAPYCPAGAGQWYRFSDILLDGSQVSGGITTVVIEVDDLHHQGVGRTTCWRSTTYCVAE